VAASIVGPVRASPGLAGGISAALNLTAPQVIKNAPGVCVKVVCIAAGNLTLNDAVTTGGASAANEFYTFTGMTVGQVVPLDWPCAAGIVASVATGTFAIAFG
jgi:hypothetical protein